MPCQNICVLYVPALRAHCRSMHCNTEIDASIIGTSLIIANTHTRHTVGMYMHIFKIHLSILYVATEHEITVRHPTTFGVYLYNSHFDLTCV